MSQKSSFPQAANSVPRVLTADTLYYNMQDVALWISDATKGNPNRLGETGPRNPTVLPANFSLVNASAAAAVDADQDATLHQYYRLNTAVRDDILAVLDGEDDIAIAEALNKRIWRPEGRYWRLEGDKPKEPKGGKKKTRGRSD